MIRKLKGIIDTIDSDFMIIDVNGVGYGVFCSANTLRLMPPKGEAVTLFIETYVREDNISLFGFATADEQETFITLQKVSGVGAKMALGILSFMSPAQLASAIAAEDQKAFKAISGVGPKLAARLITELRDKFSFVPVMPSSASAKASAVMEANNNINDAISALVNLGYGRSEAYNAVTKVAALNDNAAIDTLIKDGLKELTKR